VAPSSERHDGTIYSPIEGSDDAVLFPRRPASGADLRSLSDGRNVSGVAGWRTHLWTFVLAEGVEPTNNDADRALRHGVIYRKTSGGAVSEFGAGS